MAVAAWVVVIAVGSNRYLFWSLDSPFAVYVVAFALATLAFYAILTGLRVHLLLIWGPVMVAGLLHLGWLRGGQGRGGHDSPRGRTHAVGSPRPTAAGTVTAAHREPRVRAQPCRKMTTGWSSIG